LNGVVAFVIHGRDAVCITRQSHPPPACIQLLLLLGRCLVAAWSLSLSLLLWLLLSLRLLVLSPQYPRQTSRSATLTTPTNPTRSQ